MSRKKPKDPMGESLVTLQRLRGGVSDYAAIASTVPMPKDSVDALCGHAAKMDGRAQDLEHGRQMDDRTFYLPIHPSWAASELRDASILLRRAHAHIKSLTHSLSLAGTANRMCEWNGLAMDIHGNSQDHFCSADQGCSILAHILWNRGIKEIPEPKDFWTSVLCSLVRHQSAKVDCEPLEEMP